MVEVQCSEAEASVVVLRKEVAVEAHSRGPARVNNDRARASFTTREVAVVVEVEDLAGEITTNHSETEILLSLSVLAGL